MIPRIHQRTRWISAISLAALAGTGCSTDDRDAGVAEAAGVAAAQGGPARDSEPAAVPEDSRVQARRLVFAPCAEDPELECAPLSVPVDYANPHGTQIALATVRAPALAAHKRGVVFFNPGGPGGSGIDALVALKSVFAPLRQSFDIVSFDPRGTGRSQPVDCTFELPASPATDTLEATAAFDDEVGRRYARACREQHGALATQIGTANVARDMDVFRAALGERELNYFGVSYGTILGASYATLFPHRVRAMVLDGNVTPSWFGDYLLELDADGSAGAELALRRLDQRCRAAVDCALNTAGVVAVYDRVVERLDRNPVVVDQGVITGGSVSDAVFPLLFSELRGWPLIVRMLALADAGDYTALSPRSSSASVTEPSGLAVICDDAATRRLGLDYLPAQTGNNAIYPRFGGANLGIAITACSAWPPAHAAPVANLETRNPVVLIGNDFDPATPMAWSRNLAAALGPKATLVRYQGGGHTAYLFGSGCVDRAVESYLRDLTVPPAGLTCPAQPLAFEASLEADILSRVTPWIPRLPRRR